LGRADRSGGTVVARYDYDPYGRSTTILGITPTDLNFTGLYRHSKSNLDLATYRAYDPDLGRWLSRDPIAENGGLNLYAYVGNSPATYLDPLGLYDVAFAEGTSTHTRDLVNRGIARLDSTRIGQFLRSIPGTATFRDSPNNEERDPTN